jgi:ABC-2 type transport system ATP-binding protein
MIEIQNICQEFKVAKKEPGFLGSLKSLFAREYETKYALKNINLKINEGEIVGLIGANGAGKTTLIKILSGIIKPTQGKVSIFQFNPWDRDNRLRKQVSLIMGQKAQLWWDLPAHDCFLLLKEIYEIPTQQFQDDLLLLSEKLGIKEQLNTPVRSLSLGERMKVELMAALLHRPKIIYLDEPTIGLDLSSQKAIREFILDYHHKFKPTVIVTSHYMDDIETLCDRVIIVRKGEKIYDGRLDFIYQKYAQSKVLNLHLSQPLDEKTKLTIKNFGSMQIIDPQTIKLTILKNEIGKISSELLKDLPLHDLTIESEDISDIIERIMKEGIHV